MSILDDLDDRLGTTTKVPLFGQQEIVDQITPFLVGDTPNILLLGPPGAGKTHLARWIAGQKRFPFFEDMCPIKDKGPQFGVWLLDECHRQTAPEQLFGAMANKQVTVIGATTQPQKLDPAFRDRFFLRLHIKPLDMAARREYFRHRLGDMVPDDHIEALAKASAGNPRQGERIMVAAEALKTTDPSAVLASVRINADGLDDLHMKILETLNKASRPIGLGTLSLMAQSDELSIAEHEVLLLDLELLDLSKSGRTLTARGRKYAEVLGS